MRKLAFILISFAIPFIVISQSDTLPYVQVLGVAQDGGYPHFGCEKKCCKMAWKDDGKKRFPVALAIVDPKSKKWWLTEATPDIKDQIELFSQLSKHQYNYLPEGILITHAHIGHYAGLINLGREVMNTKSIPVYVMPQMKRFIEKNGPWSQLVALNNIELKEMKQDSIIILSKAITISPIQVPHRDEFSETVGFKIITSAKKYLFIPDIDKWQKWERSIVDEVKKVDIAFLDATFNNINELNNRKIEEVPHPFIEETMALFIGEALSTRNKIHFIHFNHTNSVMWDKKLSEVIEKKGFVVSVQGKKY